MCIFSPKDKLTMSSKTSRRNFIKMSSLAAGAGLVLPTTQTIGAPVLRKGPLADKVRLGFIGTGMRGRNHVDLALRRKDCEVASSRADRSPCRSD